MTLTNFIPRKFKNEKINHSINFNEVIKNSNISIILGEPASGKTYQLKEYSKENSNSIFVELIFIDEEEDIDDTVEIVLLDSIDEALSKNDSDKALVRKLTKYIEKSQKINPNIKFIISCRFLEWKEMFSDKLKEIDKNLKVYSIEELNKEDIDLLLTKKNINKNKFWNFIEKNYLEQLLKNILMTLHLINNFNSYKDKQLKYFEIYKKIIEEHLLAETDNERKNQLKKISLEDMVKISSIVATYMTLNRKRTVSVENINRFASELYILDDLEITGKKLEIIFDTAMFSGNRQNIRFFHKSVQEYLTAYFINLKKLDIETIQNIFAHNMGFYEEFEEVLIYLTNMESKFFKYFVAFDPFIFRRHPYLVKEEQENLFIAMLKTLEKDEQRGWGKWSYIENSSLVKLPLIKENLVRILKKYIQVASINYATNVYLISLLEHNYSNELEDIVFEVFDNIKDRKLCFRYMKAHHIDNLNFNQRLFDFLVDNNYIDDNESYLYQHLFKILYQNRKFTALLILLNHISIYQLKGSLINSIKVNDILIWFELIKKYTRNKKGYSPEVISLLIYTLLKKYNTVEDKNIVKTLFRYIDNDKSYSLKFDISNYGIDNNFLNFNDIKNEFWDYFFSKRELKRYKCDILKILNLYNISLKDIVDITAKYPIKDYKEYYICFRNYLKFNLDEVDDFLMQNIEFKSYMEELREKQKKYQDESDKEDNEWQKEIERKNKDRFLTYENAVNSLKTKEDLIIIYSYFQNEDYFSNMRKKLILELGDKYQKFMDLIKYEFQRDTTYLTIQDKLLVRNSSYTSTIFNYYFASLHLDEVKSINLSKESYRKIFWHKLKVYNFDDDYFITLSKQHIDEYINLIIQTMKSLFTQSKYIGISNSRYNYNEYFKKMGIYNKKDLKPIIEYSKEIVSIYYQTIKDDKNILIEIIAVDINNYQFILELLLKDKKNYSDYFESLLAIDINRAINDFLNIFYPKSESDYITFSQERSITFLTPICHYSQYDILKISPMKRKYFKELVGEIYYLNEYKDIDYLKELDEKNIEFILINYYKFFKQYYHPIGGYSPDIYDNMNDLINKIWSYLGEKIKYIPFLERLSSTSQGKLHTLIKRQLEYLYNLQLKNREFNNKYYKEILDNYKNKEERFFNYDNLRDDLISISLLETKNRNAIYKESEDETNDRFRNALSNRKYNVTDQSRAGESNSGINAGERDLVVCNSQGIDESVIEAFILKSLDSNVIKNHYEKLVQRYDTVGNSVNFVLVYSKTRNFNDLWEKYIEYDGFDNFVDTKDEHSQKDNVRVGISKYKKMQVYHLFINFYSYGGD